MPPQLEYVDVAMPDGSVVRLVEGAEAPDVAVGAEAGGAAEAPGVIEAVGASEAPDAAVAEAPGVAEAVGATAAPDAAVAEAPGVAEAVGGAETPDAAVAEAPGVAEAVQEAPDAAVAEAAGVAEAVGVAEAPDAAVAEAPGVVEAVRVAEAADAAVAEAPGVANAVEAAEALDAAVAEPLGVAGAVEARLRCAGSGAWALLRPCWAAEARAGAPTAWQFKVAELWGVWLWENDARRRFGDHLDIQFCTLDGREAVRTTISKVKKADDKASLDWKFGEISDNPLQLYHGTTMSHLLGIAKQGRLIRGNRPKALRTLMSIRIQKVPFGKPPKSRSGFPTTLGLPPAPPLVPQATPRT